MNSIQMAAAEQAILILQRDLAAARTTIDAQSAKLASVPEYIEYHIADREHGPFTESFDDWYSRTHPRA